MLPNSIISRFLSKGTPIILCFILSMSLIACSLVPETMKTSTIFAMDTIMELEVEGSDELLRGAEDKIRSLEKELSVTDENSDISRLNATGSTELSPEVADIMSRALDMCEKTDGDLDITIYPVLKAWGFTTGEYRVPDDKEIDELLKYVDYRRIIISAESSEGSIGSDDISSKQDSSADSVASGDHASVIGSVKASIPEGFEVDLGSVAKGYTGTLIADYFRENGVKHALINLGGNVQCLGTKPNGEKWKVAIKSPFPDSKSGIFGVLDAADTAIITSGGYERYFEEDGEIYWHILDPKTGKPARNTLASVTVVGPDGLTCDALSTALFVKGLDEAIAFWKSTPTFDAIFITDSGEVYITGGISAAFRLSSEYHDAVVKILTN